MSILFALAALLFATCAFSDTVVLTGTTDLSAPAPTIGTTPSVAPDDPNANPVVYDFADTHDLDMAAHGMGVAGDGKGLTLRNIADTTGVSIAFSTGGAINLTGAANGGALSIDASGGISLNRILTYSTGSYAPGGNITLSAGGPVSIEGYIYSYSGYFAQAGVITISGPSITIGNDGTCSVLTGGNRSHHGDVRLYSTGAVTLTGVVSTYAEAGQVAGSLTIQGNASGTLNAGNVTVHGLLDMWGYDGGGTLTIKSAGTVSILDNIVVRTEASYVNGGAVNIAGNDVTIEGYIDARLMGNGGGTAHGGTINISGNRVTLSGTDPSGCCIDTRGIGTGSLGGDITLSATSTVNVQGRVRAEGEGAQPKGKLVFSAGVASIENLDLSLIDHAEFDVQRYGMITGTLSNFDTGDPENGSLRAPAGKIVFYDAKLAGNAYLGTNTYPLADLNGNPGGGLLKPGPPIFGLYVIVK